MMLCGVNKTQLSVCVAYWPSHTFALHHRTDSGVAGSGRLTEKDGVSGLRRSGRRNIGMCRIYW